MWSMEFGKNWHRLAIYSTALLIVLVLFAGPGWSGDAGTASGAHGGGYGLELPEGATGSDPNADCLALDQLCTANNYGNTESTLPASNGCDPACDVWNPSDTPGFTVSEQYRSDPRNFLHGSWRYPLLYWQDINPDSGTLTVLNYGSLDDTLIRSIRIPFRGGELYAGSVSFEGNPSGTTCGTWTDTAGTAYLSDTPGSATALGGQSGCGVTGRTGIQFLDSDEVDAHPIGEFLANLYCVLEPDNVYYINWFTNDVNCGGSKQCCGMMYIQPAVNNTFWDNTPQGESDMLPWEY